METVSNSNGAVELESSDEDDMLHVTKKHKKKVVDCNILNCIQYTYCSFVYTVYIVLDALSELSEQDAVISNVCKTVDVMTAVDMSDEDDVLPITCQYCTPPSSSQRARNFSPCLLSVLRVRPNLSL